MKKNGKGLTKSLTKRLKLLLDLKRAGRNQARVVAAFREKVSKDMGVPVTDIICIDYLLEKCFATPGDLASVTGLTTGAITGVISRLEKRGQITYKRDAKDKRRVIIKPVIKKVGAYSAYYEPISEEIHRLHASYKPEVVVAITYHFRRVAEAFQKGIDRLAKEEKKKSKKTN